MSSPNITLIISRRDLSRSRTFSANGAASKKAWGIAPGIEIATKTSAEGAFQTDEWIGVVLELKRAFSAGPFGLFILGRCPRLVLNAAPSALTRSSLAE